MPRIKNFSAPETDRIARRVSKSETRSPLRHGAMEEGTLTIGPGASVDIQGKWTAPPQETGSFTNLSVTDLSVSGQATVNEVSSHGRADADRTYGRVLNSLQPHPDGLQDGSGQPLFVAHGATVSPVSGVEYNGSAILDSQGSATVVLPEHFLAVTKPGTAIPSAVGNGFAASWSAVQSGQFTVTGQSSGTVTWRVFAERRGADFQASGNRTEITDP